MSRNAGFSIVVALFILVVLALLGAALVTISGVEHRQPLLSLEAKRAYWAAHGGLQWGAYEALHNGICASSTMLASGQPGLNRFSVTVGCSSSAHTERGKTFQIYVITATAKNGKLGTRTDFVQRRYQEIVTNGG